MGGVFLVSGIVYTLMKQILRYNSGLLRLGIFVKLEMCGSMR